MPGTSTQSACPRRRRAKLRWDAVPTAHCHRARVKPSLRPASASSAASRRHSSVVSAPCWSTQDAIGRSWSAARSSSARAQGIVGGGRASR
ncbi:MAG: hypothetical protein R3F43_11025 [bacterium]